MTDQSKRISDEINITVRDVVRVIQLRSLQAVSSGTPVDTGFARGAWQPTITAPARKRKPAPASRADAKSAGNANLQANNAFALQLAATYQLAQGPVFLTNAVPYIEQLNEGSSSQAPSKFVERAILKAITATVASFNTP